MAFFTTVLGLLAAGLTSLSYIPQVLKVIPRRSTGDLSVRMLCALTAGLSLWVTYGIIIDDAVIIIANMIGASLAAIVLICKLRDLWLK